MRLVRWISVYMATAIVLLHSFIPHTHHSEVSITEDIRQHKDASSLLDYLALGFHMEHGDGQLCEFVSFDEVEVPAFQPLLLPEGLKAVFEPEFIPDTPQPVVRNAVRIVQSCLPTTGLRGPPAIS